MTIRITGRTLSGLPVPVALRGNMLAVGRKYHGRITGKEAADMSVALATGSTALTMFGVGTHAHMLTLANQRVNIVLRDDDRNALIVELARIGEDDIDFDVEENP